MTRVLIARHGNTFDKGDVLLRVGAGTDLPLSESGREQARLLGVYLKNTYPNIAKVYSSELKRTYQTAEIALGTEAERSPRFNEIDYGPDEGKPETEVTKRLGNEALELWDRDGVVPPGWNVDISAIKREWQAFMGKMVEEYPDETVLVVTSNGIARFAPVVLEDSETFRQNHEIKMSTGAVSSFVYKDGIWEVEYWNLRPKNCVA